MLPIAPFSVDKLILPKSMQAPLPEGRHYRFHAMIKPIGASCNLNCDYCFYLHKTELLNQGTKSQMSDTILEQHIRQYIEGQTGESIVFSWQGGEPTLLGVGFFQKVVLLQEKYKKEGQTIENDLQTNGTLLTKDWALFLKENKFHVGISIDGPQRFHDTFRVDKGGKPTFEKVMHGVGLLKEYEIPFAVLCVVNRFNSQSPLEVYDFLKQLGTYRIQFTPVVEPLTFKEHGPRSAQSKKNPLSLVTEWSVTPKGYGKFLTTIWEEWLQKDYGKIHVNIFETAVAQSLGMPAQICTTAPFCGKGVAVEHNGDVYSCDHMVYPEYKLGNIHLIHEGDLAFSPQQVQFGLDKSEKLPQQCNRCAYKKYCYGECPKNRILQTKDGDAGLNYLCEGLTMFFHHIQKDLPQIHRTLGR